MKQGKYAKKQLKDSAKSNREMAILRAIAVEKRKMVKPHRTKTRDFKLGHSFDLIELLILRRYPSKHVTNGCWSGNVAAACGRDESGVVGLVLWGEDAIRISGGGLIRISRGWRKLRHGETIVSTGKWGRIQAI